MLNRQLYNVNKVVIIHVDWIYNLFNRGAKSDKLLSTRIFGQGAIRGPAFCKHFNWSTIDEIRSCWLRGNWPCLELVRRAVCREVSRGMLEEFHRSGFQDRSILTMTQWLCFLQCLFHIWNRFWNGISVWVVSTGIRSNLMRAQTFILVT
jgi:hypothetical protein